jgi:hypothetical protein
MKKIRIAILAFLIFGISACGEQKTQNVNKIAFNPNWSSKEMLHACSSFFLYLSEIEPNPYRRGALNNAAYSFINTLRYGYDKPYFNKNAESDSKMDANKMAEQKISLNDSKSMTQACINAGREFSIIIVGLN